MCIVSPGRLVYVLVESVDYLPWPTGICVVESVDYLPWPTGICVVESVDYLPLQTGRAVPGLVVMEMLHCGVT